MARSILRFLPCAASGGGAAGLALYLMDKVIVAIEIGFTALAVFMLFLSTINMVMFAEQEDTVLVQRVDELQPAQVPAARAGRDPARRAPDEQRCHREAQLVGDLLVGSPGGGE